jgi:2-methylaconitate cis-trans-isomerase PrpF
VFFHEAALPAERPVVERILLDVFGSPDVRQIDGLGGATSQTSKAMIVGRSRRPDADVEYTFAQVSVTQALVDWGGNCGNLSAAVGPYAIDAGLVEAGGDVVSVRMYNTNTQKTIVSHVPVVDGRAAVGGEYAIPGVPGTGARILLDFLDPAGSVTGSLLPTGRPRDEVTLDDGRTFSVSVVDASNPVVFMLAHELGLRGSELPHEIEADRALLDTIEVVRGVVAERLGIVAGSSLATSTSPGVPKIGFVSAPQAYVTSAGDPVEHGAIDLTGRLMSMQTAHRAYMGTGAICTGAAAFVGGTVVQDVVREAHDRADPATIRIGHPYGVMDVAIEARETPAGVVVDCATIGRTARHILDGVVWVRADRFDSAPASETSSCPGLVGV